MANIELVIKMPEEMYNHMKILDEHGMSSDAIKIILNGTPLTKGHAFEITEDGEIHEES